MSLGFPCRTSQNGHQSSSVCVQPRIFKHLSVFNCQKKCSGSPCIKSISLFLLIRGCCPSMCFTIQQKYVHTNMYYKCTCKEYKLDRGSIRSSPRYGLSTPFRLTIRSSARLFHFLFNMGDLHLVLTALNLSIPWMVQQVSIDDVLTAHKKIRVATATCLRITMHKPVPF